MLEKNYLSMYQYYNEFLQAIRGNEKPIELAIERGENAIKCFSTAIYKKGHTEENFTFLERIVKMLLWSYGGYKITIFGDETMAAMLQQAYSPTGIRAFDLDFMQRVYLRKLEIVSVSNIDCFPKETENTAAAKANCGGYKIGFDAGGSDRKVTACIDGKVVFENETIWFPKLNSDPNYHLAGITDSIDRAKAALGGRVDAIGVSTAGVVVDEEVRIGSLFRKVPESLYKEKILPLYKNLASRYNCPVRVANDGDVAALSGAYQLDTGDVMGIAMGTSLAAGYVDGNKNIRGYLNELAFVPVDANPNAPTDEWSGDYGVGGCYHSQDGVIHLAKECGIDLSYAESPAEKLKVVQRLAEADNPIALEIFSRLGYIFGYTLLWFSIFYKIEKVIFLGRVASGKGGDTLLAEARKVLAAEKSRIQIFLPDEMSRRLGQSYTATQF